MKRIPVETINGTVYETIYEIKELSLMRHNLSCKESKKGKVTYLEIPCAFDIETTNMYQKDEAGNIITDPRPYAFMYHWQFCINEEVCFGRTWDEFRALLDDLQRRMDLDNNRRLVIWCHNLNFEFTFFKRFVHVIDGFFKDDHTPLKVVVDGGIEFRDSYILSNMNLQKFCENEPGVIHYKLSGADFNYDLIRTPLDPLSDYEKAYAYNDVRGLCECIQSRMKDDTLASMPMTSTGYVRRDARCEVRKNPQNREIFKASALDEHLYGMCRDAFRGGDSHANLRHSNQMLHNLQSWDIQSSYPACMMINRFPVAPFTRIKPETFYNYDLTDYAQLIHIRFTEIKYIGACGIPYIPLAKCLAITRKPIVDNGRILYAHGIEMIITDLDLYIIMKEYEFDDMAIKECYAARYGFLSDEYKAVVMQYFTGKTKLKGIDTKKYEYMKSKNKLNALYGMQAQRIDHMECMYDGHDFITKDVPLGEQLQKYYKSRNSFLSYQHSVWVTSWARFRLRQMMWKVGKDVVYCDTDSIKCINDHTKDFERMNEKLRSDAEKFGAYAYDKDGTRQYMGTWENETEKELYSDFKTLGSKAYVYKQGDHIVSTISGVNKKRGSEFFSEHGIDAFAFGTMIKDSGHLTAFYNDDEIHTITVNGVDIETASNVAIVDNIYTIGESEEYLDLLQKALDNQDDIFYI